MYKRVDELTLLCYSKFRLLWVKLTTVILAFVKIFHYYEIHLPIE